MSWSCDTCEHAMIQLSPSDWRWCPRCGTVKGILSGTHQQHTTPHAPESVEFLQDVVDAVEENDAILPEEVLKNLKDCHFWYGGKKE